MEAACRMKVPWIERSVRVIAEWRGWRKDSMCSATLVDGIPRGMQGSGKETDAYVIPGRERAIQAGRNGDLGRGGLWSPGAEVQIVRCALTARDVLAGNGRRKILGCRAIEQSICLAKGTAAVQAGEKKDYKQRPWTLPHDGIGLKYEP